MQCPNAMFFPVGAVLLVGDSVLPVLDPECVCDGPKCTLRADCPAAWSIFIEKARGALAAAWFTAEHRQRTLRLVCENHPQVVVGQCLRDVKGKLQWQDWCTMR